MQSVYKKEIQKIYFYFYFESLLLSFIFHFHKKLENEMQFVFCFSFSWRNWKTIYLKISRLMLWLFAQVWFTRCYRAVLFKSTKISRCTMVTWTPRTRCLENTWCTLMFILLAATFTFFLFFLMVNCDKNHISRSSHREMFS